MTTWSDIEADLASAMTRMGKSASEITTTLDALRPVVLAVERAGVRVDCDVAWALVATLADQKLRSIQGARTLMLRQKRA
jgi:predicted phosphoribosyltransferase